MGQDVLKNYHEELVQKIKNYEVWLDLGSLRAPTYDDWGKLLMEVEAAFAACRDQVRTPHQPLEGQPIEDK